MGTKISETMVEFDSEGECFLYNVTKGHTSYGMYTNYERAILKEIELRNPGINNFTEFAVAMLNIPERDADKRVSIRVVSNTGNNKITSFEEETYIHPIVDNKVLSVCCETVDVAFLYAIGYKYEGRNSKFVTYASRMLDLKTCWRD